MLESQVSAAVLSLVILFFFPSLPPSPLSSPEMGSRDVTQAGLELLFKQFSSLGLPSSGMAGACRCALLACISVLRRKALAFGASEDIRKQMFVSEL